MMKYDPVGAYHANECGATSSSAKREATSSLHILEKVKICMRETCPRRGRTCRCMCWRRLGRTRQRWSCAAHRCPAGARWRARWWWRDQRWRRYTRPVCRRRQAQLRHALGRRAVWARAAGHGLRGIWKGAVRRRAHVRLEHVAVGVKVAERSGRHKGGCGRRGHFGLRLRRTYGRVEPREVGRREVRVVRRLLDRVAARRRRRCRPRSAAEEARKLFSRARWLGRPLPSLRLGGRLRRRLSAPPHSH